MWNDEQRSDAPGFGSELQPPGCGNVDSFGIRLYLADHRGETSAAQAFFHGPQHLGRGFGADRQNARCIETEAAQAGGVERSGLGRRVRTQAPQDLLLRIGSGVLLQPRRERCGKANGSAGITRGPGHLMQASLGQATPRESTIHLSCPATERDRPVRIGRLDGAHPGAK